MNQKNICGNKITKITLTLITALLLSCALAVSTEQYINDKLRPITECPPDEVLVLDTVNGGYICLPSGIGTNLPNGESAEKALQDQLEEPIDQESKSKQ